MTQMNKQMAWAAASILALSLAACGGDDDGESVNSTFSKSNGKAIAGAVLYAQQDMHNLPLMPEGGTLKPMPKAKLDESIAVVSTKTGVATVYECDAGGTISIEILGGAGDADTPEVGDGFRYAYENCQFVNGTQVFDGTLEYTYVGVEGIPDDNSADWSASLKLSYDLSITKIGGSVKTKSGSFEQTFSYDKATDTLSSSYSNVSYSSPSGHTITWKEDYSYELTVNADGNFEFSINGTASYEGSSATITIETIEAFAKTADWRFLAGEMLISNSADGSSIHVSADGSGDLLIEVDSDGDGAYEYSITVNYDELYT